MAKKANPALIGAFVLGAIVLAVGGLVVFGGGKFFRQTQVWVGYFHESVKGLAIGSPVTFQGVKIGSVTDIKVVVDPKEMKIRTPVFFEIEADRFTSALGEIKFQKGAPGVKIMIERGLRAQLETQSFVTGQLAVALDFHPDTPVHLTGLNPDLLEMPTIPSSAEKLARTIENLPIDEITQSALKTIQGVDRLVNAPELKETIRSLSAAARDLRELAQHMDAEVRPLTTDVAKTLEATRDTLKDTQKLVQDVGGQVGPAAASVEKTLTAARTTLEGAQRTLGTVTETVAETSSMQHELTGALRELSAALRSIRTLSDYLERHPDALLFGKGAAGGK